MKNLNKKVILSLMLAIILVFSLTQIAKVHSAQLTEEDKASTFLTNVVKLDLTKYNVQVAHLDFPASGVSFDKLVKFNLTSDESKVDVMFLFANNSLYWCTLYALKGSPIFAQPAASDTLSSVKGFLERLQNYSATTYLPQILSKLDTVSELKSMTITDSSIEQTVTTKGDVVTIKWSSNVNNIDNSQKQILLTLNNGNFEFFCDKWNTYQIGNTNVNVTKQEAIKIAIEHAQAYSWKVGDETVSNVTVLDIPVIATLSMQNRGNATLFPLWDINLPLDKVYLGGVTSIRVLLWADTGDVLSISASGGYGVEQNDQNSTATSAPILGEIGLTIAITTAATTIVIASYLLYKRRK